MERQQITKTNQGDHQSQPQLPTKLAWFTHAPADPFLQLQRALGNQAVGRFIQAKLKVSQPGDVYEQEADRVADQVMRMPDQTTPATVRPDGLPQISRLQRKCAQCKEEEEEETLQAKEAAGQTPEVTPAVQAQINNLRGGGQPLPTPVRAFFEPQFGYDFSQVRVHTDAQAAESARAVKARAYTVGPDVVFGAGQYAPETMDGRRLLAHELSHVVQQRNTAGLQKRLVVGESDGPIERETDNVADRLVESRAVAQLPAPTGAAPLSIQRDLALEPPEEVPEQPDLTDDRAQAAIRYNRASYSEESIRLIQDLVGVEPTGTFDEATVRAIARIQRDFGLRADGKVGPDTYDLLIRELQVEGAPPENCLTLFQIVGPEPLAFFRSAANPSQGTIGSRFFIKARFDPRCNCEDFEYRQFIAGNVELHDVAGPTFNLNSLFLVPGGLSSTLQEDGDTSIPAGTAGHHYGHRSDADNPGDDRDRYLPDRRTGCEYAGHDFPELGPLPAAPGDAGDRYEWTMRFRGVIKRKGHGVVEEKYWVIRGPVVIP